MFLDTTRWAKPTYSHQNLQRFERLLASKLTTRLTIGSSPSEAHISNWNSVSSGTVLKWCKLSLWNKNRYMYNCHVMWWPRFITLSLSPKMYCRSPVAIKPLGNVSNPSLHSGVQELRLINPQVNFFMRITLKRFQLNLFHCNFMCCMLLKQILTKNLCSFVNKETFHIQITTIA